MILKALKTTLFFTVLCFSINAKAQCNLKNEAFKSGEFLAYNMYYNWKFIWVKAGTASMSIVESTYNGTPAFRGSLITRGSERADNFFILRDTLLCYSTFNLIPLYFRKGAREGKRYTVDEVFYNYQNGKTNLTLKRLNNDGTLTTSKKSINDCVYDMMNIFLAARSYNADEWTKGHEVKFPIADGNDVTSGFIRYIGKSTIKADNRQKYRCIELAYIEKKGDKWREIARFFVTDDKNHIPIRIDLNLRFGTAKAFLTSTKGLKQ